MTMRSEWAASWVWASSLAGVSIALAVGACGPREPLGGTAHPPPTALADAAPVATPSEDAGPDPDAAIEPLPPILRTVRAKARRPHSGEYDVTLDITEQVLALHLPAMRTFESAEVGKEAQLLPSFAGVPSGWSRGMPFVSAAALALEAKQFDDGLVAAIELAADAGQGAFPSRTTLVETLVARLATAASTHDEIEAAAIVAAAARLGGWRGPLPPKVAVRAHQLRKQFLAKPGESKPLGFYTWNAELTRLFRRDRMLQSALSPQTGAVMANALAVDDASVLAYEAWLGLAERLTNPLERPDLRAAARIVRGGGQPPDLPSKVTFAPASRSNETDLGLRLYGGRLIPEGFDLAAEMIEQIQAGTLTLEPRPNSGWYDHQSYALEPLVVLDRMPEGARLQATPEYRNHLAGLFRSLLALTRETHVKQVARVRMGAALPPPIIVLDVRPGLSIEPLPSYYLRRAASYRFVRGVLEQAFGPEELQRLHRLRSSGPVQATLQGELEQIERLFFGAYLTACAEIGLRCDADGSPHGSATSARAELASWASNLAADPDVGADMRMMVPVFYDIGRRKLKVWAVLGVAHRSLRVTAEQPPKLVAVTDADGNPVPLGSVRAAFRQEQYTLAYLVTAEVYVSRLLDRREFRRHCDRYKTPSAILKHLR